MFSLIHGGADAADSPKPGVRVTDVFALAESTRFTVVDDTMGTDWTTRTTFGVYRVDQNHETAIGSDCGRVSACVSIPDAALDTVIRALENARDIRDAMRPARVRFAPPLVEDEPNDDAGPSVARGHAAVETLRGTSAGNAIADALEAHRGGATDGPVAA